MLANNKKRKLSFTLFLLMIIYRTFIKSYNILVKYRKYCIFLENMVYIVNKMMTKLIEFSYRKIFQKNNFMLKSFDCQINRAFIKILYKYKM
ncbi:hypothetical protein [Streptococcus agalactiae]|uniref:hypothetical protein n=1 Tax=Streptococcus agalactiae TaxID=1311 RepID=UPI000E1C2555|nr:hypothetical protein [Streptococcus agalactiae]